MKINTNESEINFANTLLTNKIRVQVNVKLYVRIKMVKH